MSDENLTYIVEKKGFDRKVIFHFPPMSDKGLRHLNDILRPEFSAYSKTVWEHFAKIDAVKEYHVKRGCCDGSDPSACFQRRLEAEAEAKSLAAEERRQQRLLEANEYYGTEGTE